MVNKAIIFLFLPLLLSIFLFPISTPTAQAQTQSDPSLSVSTASAGLKELPLKAIKHPSGEIDVQPDFEIEPTDIITLDKGKEFHVLPHGGGSVIAVKITNQEEQTANMEFAQADGRVRQNLDSDAYLLDVVIEMENGDRYLYETVLAVLNPGENLSQINTQNIIQNFVTSTSTSNSHTTVVFREDDDNDDDNEPEEELSVCYFHPNDDPHCVPVDGECPEDAPNMNEQGNCHPSGCPDGYSMLDDDETGTCYSDNNVIVCPGSNAKVLDRDDCAIYEPGIAPETLATNEPITCQEGFVLENGKCAALDSNCGGIPCTASDKEDSTTTPAEPETSDSEESNSDNGDNGDDNGDGDSGDGNDNGSDSDDNNSNDNDNDNDSDEDNGDDDNEDEDEDEDDEDNEEDDNDEED